MFTTEIRAFDPQTKELCLWAGPNVPGISFADAQNYCENNGLGYCRVTGILISEIPCKDNSLEPDWNKRIDYDVIHMN